MFLVADDNVRVVDRQGRVVGFIFRRGFTQLNPDDMETNNGLCDKPYDVGLSPFEMEMVAEVVERNLNKKGRRHNGWW